jgi:uncharacterized protein YecE (DUF72 family)
MTGVAMLRLGCPVWACDAWRGALYTRHARRQDFLGQYARVFGCVEGNSTFYGLPPRPTIERWAEEAPSGFRFCFKFPQMVTHRMLLRYADAERRQFFAALEPLAGKLGPLMLQLPPNFAGADLAVLLGYLDGLPRDFAYAVEVRHADWYDGATFELALDAGLTARNIARVNFDTRDLFAADAPDSATHEAQARKPRLPARAVTTNATPLLRFVGRNEAEHSRAALASWADTIAGWLRRGLEPYVFTHAPDDAHAPQLARLLHVLVRERVPALPELARFPGEDEPPDVVERQADLFG